jgi:hypothetical protein
MGAGDAAFTTPNDDEIPRVARRVVTVLLVLLFVPAVVGFDAWPLTAWRLYSVSRDSTQTGYEVEAITAGEETRVKLAELPLGYRNGEWALEGYAKKSAVRREELCQAFLTGVREDEPDASGVRIHRVEERLVRDSHGWRVELDRDEVLHECHR